MPEAFSIYGAIEIGTSQALGAMDALAKKGVQTANVLKRVFTDAGFLTALSNGLRSAGDAANMLVNALDTPVFDTLLRTVTGFTRGAVGSFMDASMEAKRYELTLTALYRNADTARGTLQRLYQFAKTTPFDTPEVVQAATIFKALNLNIEESLYLSGELASTFQTSLGDAANAVGKAMTGSAEGFEILRNRFGLTNAELKRFGGSVDDNNQIILKGTADVRAMQDAVRAWVKETTGGKAMSLQMETLSTAISNLRGDFWELAKDLGDVLAPALTFVVAKLNAMVNWLQTLAPWQKQFLAWTVAVTGGLALIVATLAPLVLLFGHLLAVGLSLTGMFIGLIIPLVAVASKTNLFFNAMRLLSMGLINMPRIVAGASSALSVLGATMTTLLTRAGPLGVALARVMGVAGSAAGKVAGGAVDFLGGLLGFAGGKQALSKNWTFAAAGAGEAIKDATETATTQASSKLTTWWNGVKAMFGKGLTLTMTIVGISAVVGGAVMAISWVKNWVRAEDDLAEAQRELMKIEHARWQQGKAYANFKDKDIKQLQAEGVSSKELAAGIQVIMEKREALLAQQREMIENAKALENMPVDFSDVGGRQEQAANRAEAKVLRQQAAELQAELQALQDQIASGQVKKKGLARAENPAYVAAEEAANKRQRTTQEIQKEIDLYEHLFKMNRVGRQEMIDFYNRIANETANNTEQINIFRAAEEKAFDLNQQAAEKKAQGYKNEADMLEAQGRLTLAKKIELLRLEQAAIGQSTEANKQKYQDYENEIIRLMKQEEDHGRELYLKKLSFTGTEVSQRLAQLRNEQIEMERIYGQSLALTQYFEAAKTRIWEDEKRRRLAIQREMEKDQIKNEQTAIDSKIIDLEDQLSQGGQVRPELKALYKKRQEQQEKEAEADARGKIEQIKPGEDPSGNQAANIIKNRDAAIAKSKEDLKIKLRQSAREEEKFKADQQTKELEATKKQLEFERSMLEARAAQGKNVRFQIMENLRQQLSLEQQIMEAKAEQDKMGKSPVEKARIEKQLRMDILKHQKDSLKTIQDQTSAFQDQVNKTKAEEARLRGERVQKRGGDFTMGGIYGSLEEAMNAGKDPDAVDSGSYGAWINRNAGAGAAKDRVTQGILTNQQEHDRIMARGGAGADYYNARVAAGQAAAGWQRGGSGTFFDRAEGLPSFTEEELKNSKKSEPQVEGYLKLDLNVNYPNGTSQSSTGMADLGPPGSQAPMNPNVPPGRV